MDKKEIHQSIMASQQLIKEGDSRYYLSEEKRVTIDRNKQQWICLTPQIKGIYSFVNYMFESIATFFFIDIQEYIFNNSIACLQLFSKLCT